MPFRAPRGVALAIALPLVAVVASACTGLPPVATAPGPVVGQGDVTSEHRPGGDFRHLSVGGGFHVEITAGSPTAVTLSAQSNLLPLISTDVVEGQLVVNIKPPGISTSQPMTLTVVVPDLRSLTLSGGATGTMELAADDLALDVSGGAILEATGSARTLALTASGGAQARLGGLISDSARVMASGGCQAELTVLGQLTGDATGGATIRLTRRPGTIDVTTSGGGMVIGG